MSSILALETYAIDGKLYQYTSKSIVATEKMMMKDSSEMVLEQQYIRKGLSGEGNIFRIKTHKATYGKENASLKISRDMNTLVNDIGVATNTVGKVTKITNKPEVLEKWQHLRKKWKKESTKEEKEQVLRTIATVDKNIIAPKFDTDMTAQGAFHLLFPGLYGKHNGTKGKTIVRDLPKFLVTQPLPLQVTYKVTEHNHLTNTMIIEGKGTLDEERLDKNTLNKLIRTLKDKINLKVELQVAYKERFEYDSYHWLNKATQQVQVKIPGFYMVESEQEITQIDHYG